MSYSSYDITKVYHEKEADVKVINFELDERDKIYILTRFKTTFKKNYYIKVMNI